MRLKSFYAKTMTEAMQMVRESLGEDAIIVATREENGGKAVRVTAAIDDKFYSATSAGRDATRSSFGNELAFELGKGGQIADRDDWLQYDDEQDDESFLTEAIIDTLLKHGAPEDILDQIVNCAAMSDLDEAQIAFIAAIDTLFSFTPLPTGTYKKAMMFVGEPGAGKTLAVAKMAARGVMNGLNVAVITTDTVRAGGIEQLQSFTKLLHIDLKTARNANELAKRLEESQDKDQILIDTPGFNPFKTEDMRSLAKLIASGDIEPVLTLAAAGDADLVFLRDAAFDGPIHGVEQVVARDRGAAVLWLSLDPRVWGDSSLPATQRLRLLGAPQGLQRGDDRLVLDDGEMEVGEGQELAAIGAVEGEQADRTGQARQRETVRPLADAGLAPFDPVHPGVHQVGCITSRTRR